MCLFQYFQHQQRAMNCYELWTSRLHTTCGKLLLFIANLLRLYYYIRIHFIHFYELSLCFLSHILFSFFLLASNMPRVNWTLFFFTFSFCLNYSRSLFPAIHGRMNGCKRKKRVIYLIRTKHHGRYFLPRQSSSSWNSLPFFFRHITMQQVTPLSVANQKE